MKRDRRKSRLLIDEKQLCKWLGVTQACARAWRNRGIGGPVWIKVGRLVRYDERDVEEWLRDQTVDK